MYTNILKSEKFLKIKGFKQAVKHKQNLFPTPMGSDMSSKVTTKAMKALRPVLLVSAFFAFAFLLFGTSGIMKVHTAYAACTGGTVATGSDPATATIAPGTATTTVDVFTLAASGSQCTTETFSSITISLAGSGTPYQGVAWVGIMDSTDTTLYFTASTSVSSNTIKFSGGTSIAVSSATTFHIRVVPLSHSAMPAVPGASYAITATATAGADTAGNTAFKLGTDSANTITIDNLSPNGATGASATAGNAQVTLNWTNSNSSDFSQVVILRNTASISDVPVEGATYSAGNTIGSSSVVYVNSGTSYTDTGRTNGTAYFYKIFSKDSNGNYSTPGVQVSAVPSSYTISGTVYADEGVTATTSVVTVMMSVNGAATTSTTTVSGAFTFTVSTPSSGAPVTIYLSGGSKGAIVTRASSTASSMTGLDIYVNRLRVTSNDGGSVTNANIGLWDKADDATNMFYSYTAGTGALAVDSGYKLNIVSGATYAPGGNVTVDALKVSGIYSGSAETLTLAGNGSSTTCTANAGTVEPLCVSGTFTAPSTVNFTGTGSVLVYPTTYTALGFGIAADSNAATYTLSANATTSALTLGNAASGATDTVDLSGFTLVIAGSGTPVTNTGKAALSGSSGTVRYTSTSATTVASGTYPTLLLQPSGAGSPIYTLQSGTTTAASLTIGDGTNAVTASSSAGTGLSISGDFLLNSSATLKAPQTMYVGGNWNSSSGTFTNSSGTVILNAASGGKSITGMPFYNLIINGGGLWTNSTANGTIANDLTLAAGTLQGTQNLTVNGNVTGTGGVINFSNGMFTQSVGSNKSFGTTSGSANWTFNSLTFQNASGSNTIVTQTGGSGTITAAGTLSIASGLTLDAGNRTWILSGGGTPFVTSGTLTASSSTFSFQATSAAAIASTTYYNLTLAPSGAGSPTFSFQSGTTTVNNNMVIGNGTNTITASTTPNSPSLAVTGSLTVNANATLNGLGTGSIIVGGGVAGSGTINLAGGSFELRGSNNFGSSANWTFNNLNIGNGAAASITAIGSGSITVGGTLAIGSTSTLNAGTKTWTLTATGTPLNITSGGTFTASTSKISFAATSGTTTVPSLSYYNLDVSPASGSGVFQLPAGGSGSNSSASTIIQHVNNNGTTNCGSTTSCTTTIASTGSGHLLVLFLVTSSGPGNITSVTGGGNWVVSPSGCYVNSVVGSVDCAYVTSSTPGATSVTVNFVGSFRAEVEFYEVAYSGSINFDTAGNRSASNANPQPGVALTLGGKDIIFQAALNSAISGTSFSAISGAYSINDAYAIDGSYSAGFASALDTTDGSAPNWTQDTNRSFGGSALAFTIASWYNSSWGYRKAITIDHTKIASSTGETYVNFPVLISTTDTDLKNNASSTGADILFTSSDGTTKLNHEIEKYDSSTGQLIAWVKMPSLSTSTDTTLYMYYGNALATSQQNATGTWDSSYAAVWHLNDVTNPADSRNQNNGTNHSATAVTGQIGNGVGFASASSQYISTTQNSSQDLGNTLTLETWANITTKPVAWTSTLNYLLTKGTDGTTRPYGIYLLGDAGFPSLNFGSILSGNVYEITTYDITGLATGTWYHIAGTYDGSTIRLYVNGVDVKDNSVAFTVPTSTYPIFLGALNYGGSPAYMADDLLDETRVSGVTRSADWIKTEFNNQNSPLNFATTSTAVAYSGGSSSVATTTISGNLTLGGSGTPTLDAYTNNAALVIAGNVTIGSGAAFLAPSSSAFTISGNFTNNGTFTHEGGTVTFVPTATSTITSTAGMVFNNMTVTAAGKALQFQASSNGTSPVFTFAGTFTVTGQSGSLITIQSDASGTQWLAHFNSAQSAITYAYIKDSGCDAGSSLVTQSGKNNSSGGNNGSCWGFGASVTVSYGGGGSYSVPVDNGQGSGSLNTGNGNPSQGGGSGGTGSGSPTESGGGSGATVGGGTLDGGGATP